MYRDVSYRILEFSVLLFIVVKALLPGEVDSEEDGKRKSPQAQSILIS